MQIAECCRTCAHWEQSPVLATVYGADLASRLGVCGAAKKLPTLASYRCSEFKAKGEPSDIKDAVLQAREGLVES